MPENFFFFKSDHGIEDVHTHSISPQPYNSRENKTCVLATFQNHDWWRKIIRVVEQKTFEVSILIKIQIQEFRARPLDPVTAQDIATAIANAQLPTQAMQASSNSYTSRLAKRSSYTGQASLARPSRAEPRRAQPSPAWPGRENRAQNRAKIVLESC